MLKVTNSVGALIMAAFLLVGSSAPAAEQNRYVDVNIQVNGVHNLIAADLSDLLDITITGNDVLLAVTAIVQAPIGIAANVCNIGANVLAADINQDGTANCDAEQTSSAFNRFVLHQMNLN